MFNQRRRVVYSTFCSVYRFYLISLLSLCPDLPAAESHSTAAVERVFLCLAGSLNGLIGGWGGGNLASVAAGCRRWCAITSVQCCRRLD